MKMDLSQFESRKRSHLQHALDARSQSDSSSKLDRVNLQHCALPELDLDEVSLATPFRRRKLATPFFVAGMTAGHPQAAELNRRLARACAARGWMFGVGSQRRDLDPALGGVDGWRALRESTKGAGDLVVIGNLGLSQVVATSAKELQRLAKDLGADAFAIHLNALQEALQPEGTPHFRKGIASLRKLSAALNAPLVLKETGCGFSPRALRSIRALPIAAVDVSGTGGTHWGRIEGFRAEEAGDRVRARAAATFADWGISTVDSVIAARKILRPTVEIWASGGIRSGLDAAKLIALGATRVGFARPALEAALASESALREWMESMEFELRLALFASGYRTPADLRRLAARKGDVTYDES